MTLILEVAGGVVLGVLVLIVLYGVIREYSSQIADGLIQLVVWPVVFLIAFGLFGFACWGFQGVWRYFVPRYVGRDAAHMILDPVLAFAVIVGPFLFLFDSLNGFKWTVGMFRKVRRRLNPAPRSQAERLTPSDMQ